MGGPRDRDGTIPVLSGPLSVRLAHNELMEATDEWGGKGRTPFRDEAMEEVERLLMVLGFDVVLQWFSPDGDSLLQHQVRLAQRERIAFDSIGVVRHFHLKLLTQFADLGSIERPKTLKSLELIVDPVPNAAVEKRRAASMA